MARFSEIEADSGWQFLRALSRLPSSKHRALLFDAMLEEKEHAAQFSALSHRLAGRRLNRPQLERKALIDEGDGLADFLAYVYAGELDISGEFGAYSRAVPIPEARALFADIQGDEADHHEILWATLTDSAENVERAQVLVRRARRRRAWKDWQGVGKGIGDKLLGFWLMLVFVLLGPFGVFAARRRLATHRPQR